MTRTRTPVAAIAFVALAALGCDDALITEVLLVVTSDLRPNVDLDSVVFQAQAGPGFPPQFTPCGNPSTVASFPVSMGFVSGGSTHEFSVTVLLGKNFNQQLVMVRTVTGIRFVPDQLRMLVLPMSAACKCIGTSCPSPDTNPDCANIENPPTVPFDPLVAPHEGPFPSRCQTFFSGGGGPVFDSAGVR